MNALKLLALTPVLLVAFAACEMAPPQNGPEVLKAHTPETYSDAVAQVRGHILGVERYYVSERYLQASDRAIYLANVCVLMRQFDPAESLGGEERAAYYEGVQDLITVSNMLQYNASQRLRGETLAGVEDAVTRFNKLVARYGGAQPIAESERNRSAQHVSVGG